MARLDDPHPLFAPPPPGMAQPVFYLQGTIVTFDQVTLENTVLIGTTVLSNLPLLAVGEAALLVAGAVVGIQVTDGQYAIIGRYVIPGTADATDATALLSSFIHADTVAIQEATNSATYTNLATAGPAVTVTVRATGRLLCILTAQVQWNSPTPAALQTVGGRLTFDMSGANTMAATTVDDTLAPINSRGDQVSTGTITGFNQVSVTAAGVFEGLNSGETVLTMRYLSTSGQDVDFGRRTLIAITL